MCCSMSAARSEVMNRVLTMHPGEPAQRRAFEELLGANLDALYRTALRLCDGRAADAEDLLQDAMLRAFERRRDLRDPGAGRPWLFTILIRTNLNRVRGRTRRPETLESDLDEREFESALAAWSSADSPEEWLDRLQLAEHVRRALDGLDPQLRAVVLLTDVEEFSHREAAAMLDIPQGTVASRLFRARRALRDALTGARDNAARRIV